MGVDPVLFDSSLEALMADPDIAREISDMHSSMERLLSMDVSIVPREFTEQVFANKLRDSVVLIQEKIKYKPIRNSLDLAVLHAEISDELFPRYPYSEKIDRSASLKYHKSTDPAI